MTHYLIGTSGWTNLNWVETFYPEGLAKTKWLRYYSTQFSTLEINATFYRNFQDKVYLKWHDEVPDDFKFILKAPQLITHRKFLKNCQEDIQQFNYSANLLNKKLGLILLQLAPNTPYDLDVLEKAMLSFDNPHKIAIEFRHDQWINKDVRDLLETLGCVFCIPESPQTTLIPWVTSDIAYIRLHGRRQWYKDNYTPAEINDIAAFVKQLQSKETYILFNNTYYPYAPHNALALRSSFEYNKPSPHVHHCGKG